MKNGIIMATLMVIAMVAVTSASPLLEYSHKPKIKSENGGSANWAGYAVDSPAGSVTDVKGSWTVPAVTCSSRRSRYSSFWTGIDGDNSNTVEQIGTDSDCRNGKPNYYSWYDSIQILDITLRYLSSQETIYLRK